MNEDEERRLALAVAIEAVTAFIIHDLSQPLAAIVTSGEASLRWLDRPEPGIEEAKTAANRIVETAMAAGDKLSTYRRSSAGSRRAIDLAALIQEAIVELAEERVTILFEKAWVEPVQGDAALLRIALLHVLRNAIDAIGRGGGGTVRLYLGRGGQGGACITVEDDGPGLPAEEKTLVKPFFSTQPGRLGLGLAIARTVAESHGGRLHLANGSAGRGAVVQFWLPA